MEPRKNHTGHPIYGIYDQNFHAPVIRVTGTGSVRSDWAQTAADADAGAGGGANGMASGTSSSSELITSSQSPQRCSMASHARWPIKLTPHSSQCPIKISRAGPADWAVGLPRELCREIAGSATFCDARDPLSCFAPKWHAVRFQSALEGGGGDGTMIAQSSHALNTCVPSQCIRRPK